MTDDPDRDPPDRDPPDPEAPTDEPRDHRFSAGRGFDDPYEGFDLDPPELAVDPDEVDPVDAHVLGDLLDERQIAADDVDAEELIDVGLNYVGINRFEEATETFERAARFAGDETIEQEAWVNKGVAHSQLEEYDAAIGALREALHVDEDGEFAADAHANLAYALWEFGDDEAAFHHAEEAVRADERLPQAWFNLGFVQVERGQYEDALECLDNAIRLGHRSAAVYREKARALEGLGREEAAREAIEQAEQIQEDLEEELLRE